MLPAAATAEGGFVACESDGAAAAVGAVGVDAVPGRGVAGVESAALKGRFSSDVRDAELAAVEGLVVVPSARVPVFGTLDAGAMCAATAGPSTLSTAPTSAMAESVPLGPAPTRVVPSLALASVDGRPDAVAVAVAAASIESLPDALVRLDAVEGRSLARGGRVGLLFAAAGADDDDGLDSSVGSVDGGSEACWS